MIAEVRLANFKCFEALQLPLRPLTLLAGRNSTGKSTVLQAILLLRQSARHGQLERGCSAILNGDLVNLGDAAATVREGAEVDSTVDIEIAWGGGFEAKWQLVAKGDGLEVDGVPGDLDWERRPPFERSHYISADRIGPRVVYPTSDVVMRTARDVGVRGELVAHYLAEHGERTIENPAVHFAGSALMGIDADPELPPADSLKLRHEVDAWLGLLVPGVRVTAEKPRGLDVVQLTFQFPGTVGLTDPRRPTHVGFGLTFVLPILVAVLSAPVGSLIVLENPEAHLHPSAQRLLMNLLARAAASGVQILVETHSDHVLNGTRLAVRKGIIRAEDTMLHFFDRDVNTGKPSLSSPRILPTGALTEWPPGFFDEWDRALDQLFS